MKHRTSVNNSNTMLCLLTALWLVMQVFVASYHHHAGAFHTPHSAQVQWQNAGEEDHDCVICSLHYSPSSPAVEAACPPVPDETRPSWQPGSRVIAQGHIGTPPVRAPPAA